LQQVAAGLTFKVYEWQSVLAARVLAGRATLPHISEQRRWEEERIKVKGDSVPFTAIFPKFEEYFEQVRALAGEPSPGQPGRRLPKYDPAWTRLFLQGHHNRIRMWKRANAEAEGRVKDAEWALAKL
jgi:hypothetical protein